MAAKLKAGTNSDFNASMAKAIEEAFKKEWLTVMQGGNSQAEPQPPAFNAQMRIMFVAVAQGVVNHILNTPLSISITLHDSGGSRTYDSSSLTIKS